MFRFGMFALEQFKSRLGEWPQYSSQLTQIEHLNQHHPDLIDEIRRSLKSSNVVLNEGSPEVTEDSESARPGEAELSAPARSKPIPAEATVQEAPAAAFQPPTAAVMAAPTAAASPAMATLDQLLNLEAIMPAGAENMVILATPSEAAIERIGLVFNNVSLANVDAKVAETKAVLEPNDYSAWFGEYLVVRQRLEGFSFFVPQSCDSSFDLRR
jgi:CCR4-NOT transcription complex subunit 1